MSTFAPKGPFDLANQNQYFGGWPTYRDSIVMAFPVEGWQSSAAVIVSRGKGEKISISVHGRNVDVSRATSQALAVLSLDVDGSDWPSVGKKDRRIGHLQVKYGYVRPILFHSPYEAAAHFIIGHRISIKQGQAIRAKMSEAAGDAITVDGNAFHAFPLPRRLLEISEFSGLNATKIKRLHGIAQAALAGTLDREHLRELPVEEARKQLLGLDGVGPFFASGILNRGVGVVDAITEDDLTRHAVKAAYQLRTSPTYKEVLRIAENWKPFRMWAEVLLHIWLWREIGLPKREFQNS